MVTCIHTYIHTYIYIHSSIHPSIHPYIHIYINMHWACHHYPCFIPEKKEITSIFSQIIKRAPRKLKNIQYCRFSRTKNSQFYWHWEFLKIYSEFNMFSFFHRHKKTRSFVVQVELTQLIYTISSFLKQKFFHVFIYPLLIQTSRQCRQQHGKILH